MNLRSLIGRLDEVCRGSLEGAAGLCLSRTHYNVEIEHWLLKLLDAGGTDLEYALRHFEIDPADVARQLARAMERLKTGNARPPALSPSLVELAREAWLVASLDFEASSARSGHVLLALLTKDSLTRQALDSCPALEKVQVEVLRNQFQGITKNSAEAVATSTGGKASAPAQGAPRSGGALDQYTNDLTAAAREGRIDPVLGRDSEIRQIIDILTRRRQNNPILTGEPGVGKTAVAEGFALRIAAGDVPEQLKNVSVRSLDLALLQAGAGVKGEFENRLKGVINEVKSSEQPVILFIDEAHTLIGAGGSAGQGDAANLLKPALARGELRTIAATTWAEYKKYFERDAALARRFQVVKVEEPSEAVATEIMRGLVSMMETHHKLRITDEALRESVRLSNRYITGRQLPDKSVSVLDTACARVALSQSSTPAAIEDCNRTLTRIDTALRMIERERTSGPVDEEAEAKLMAERESESARLVALEERWNREKDLVREMGSIRDEIEAEGADDAAREDARNRLQARLAELRQAQGEDPLVHPWVDGQAIAEVISNWTGIPVGRMVSDEIKTILSLGEQMRRRVVGQDHAIESLAERIRMSRANLTDPNRPIGVFMLVGTSGVGKTETAISLAELLYGGEQNMTVINMSEFKEEHKVSLLMGSPPGYVGYGEGGILTEAVRRKPYSVVLLDELEKAHPGVQDVFYQVFDKGSLRDGEGRDIDFRNTVILMTTNAGTDTIMSLMGDPETMPNASGLAEALKPELLKTFKPAFLGRVTLLPYFPLSDEVIRNIVRLKLDKVVRRVAENYSAELTYDDAVVDAIAARCTEVESGARNIDHILNGSILPEMATRFLGHLADGNAVTGVSVQIAEDGTFQYALRE
ncbi:MAG: type VI secretion system ATPase TssH [Planctomycetota bacterium]